MANLRALLVAPGDVALSESVGGVDFFYEVGAEGSGTAVAFLEAVAGTSISVSVGGEDFLVEQGAAAATTSPKAFLETLLGEALAVSIGGEDFFYELGAVGRRRRHRRYQVDLKTGLVEVDTLAEVVALLDKERKSAIVTTPQGVTVKVPKRVNQWAIEARIRAEIEAEMDDEELLLMYA